MHNAVTSLVITGSFFELQDQKKRTKRRTHAAEHACNSCVLELCILSEELSFTTILRKLPRYRQPEDILLLNAGPPVQLVNRTSQRCITLGQSVLY